jgi:hypothetical protein
MRFAALLAILSALVLDPSPRRPAAAFDRERGITGGLLGVALPVRARLAAYLDKPLGGRVDAETPSDRRHAPHEISPAAVRP